MIHSTVDLESSYELLQMLLNSWHFNTDLIKKNKYWTFHRVSSHCWSSQVIDRELAKTLVIEDDVRFEHQFKKKLMKLMDDIDQAQLDWELMWVTRQIFQSAPRGTGSFPGAASPTSPTGRRDTSSFHWFSLHNHYQKPKKGAEDSHWFWMCVLCRMRKKLREILYETRGQPAPQGPSEQTPHPRSPWPREGVYSRARVLGQ